MISGESKRLNRKRSGSNGPERDKSSYTVINIPMGHSNSYLALKLLLDSFRW
jgi:hypothetical protein